MTLPRFYCQTITSDTVQLNPTESRHMCAVLRLSAHAKVELIDGKGNVALADIEKKDSKKAVLRIESIVAAKKPAHGHIVIAPSIAKGERFEWLISKCTELGVDRIIPILFERTIKQPKNPRIVEKWQEIVIAAAKQCRRIFFPIIDTPIGLSDAVKLLKKDYPQAKLLIGDLSPESSPLMKKNFGGIDSAAFIGPEGGLTDSEQALLNDAGCLKVRLAENILRVETAALSFAAILTAMRDAQTHSSK